MTEDLLTVGRRRHGAVLRRGRVSAQQKHGENLLDRLAFIQVSCRSGLGSKHHTRVENHLRRCEFAVIPGGAAVLSSAIGGCVEDELATVQFRVNGCD